MTGIEVYQRNLLDNLAGVHNIELTVITPKPIELESSIQQRIIRNPYSYVSGSYLWLPYATSKIEKGQFDLLHFPEQIPFLSMSSHPSVATQFDLTAFVYPQGHPKKRVLLHRLLTRRHLSSQRIVITSSESTKHDLVRMFGFSSEKIRVTHLAVSSIFKPQSAKEKRRVREKYELTERYLLTVGTIEPRKNPSSILRAFLGIENPELSLVYVGRAGWKCDALVSAFRKGSFGNRVRWLSYVDIDDLPALYSGAEIFIFPSFYEGFGFPVLEAMACGTPCIASDRSSLPEIIGNAGIMVNPYDCTELRNALLRMLRTPSLLIDFRERGLKRAKCFSWQKTSHETVAAYFDALS
jgi:glycosyltransferase involved in cell wall biosynthesis